MPPPKRSAPPRTAAAIAEDLMQTRWVGGLNRAGDAELTATLDWLSVAGVGADDTPLARARDLLLHYLKGVCDAHADPETSGSTAIAAAASLQQLMLRSVGDTRLAQSIRRGCIEAVGHNISSDAVRHREDRLIAEVAGQVAADLEVRRLDIPQTVEAAIHRLAPTVIDLREDLHDFLCMIYAHVPPADPRERRVMSDFYKMLMIKFGWVLVDAEQLSDVGLRVPDLSNHEFGLISLARSVSSFLFQEGTDRRFLLTFMQNEQVRAWDEGIDQLLSTDEGRSVYGRWVAWVEACYPTCAFERTTNPDYMCSPHAFLTLLYDFEAAYAEVGYSAVQIGGTYPPRHHGYKTP